MREGGKRVRIDEHTDCTPAQLAVGEVNAGIYAVDATFLLTAL